MKARLITILLALAAGAAFSQGKDAPRPFVLGEIRELQSAILHEKRILNICLPDGYNPKDTVKYPVIYLLDGSADEDFIHVVGLVQFNSFPWIARLPKSIVVGIANTDRKRDFTYPTTIQKDKALYKTTGGSADFMAFVEKELQPFIQRSYRTAPARTIIGESLGGLLATEILFKKPRLFDKYIIISPSLWWDNGSLLQYAPSLPETGPGHKTDIYIGVGKEGLTPGDAPRVMEVDANLLADKIRGLKAGNVQVFFDYLPGEDHATIAHQAVFNAFRLLYPAAKQ